MITAAACTPEQGCTVPIHYPFAPTEFPTGRSATRGLRRWAPSHSAACTSQEEETGRRVTSEDGYLLRLTPGGLGINLAIGQSSTDSNRTRSRTLRDVVAHPTLPRNESRSCLPQMPPLISAGWVRVALTSTEIMERGGLEGYRRVAAGTRCRCRLKGVRLPRPSVRPALGGVWRTYLTGSEQVCWTKTVTGVFATCPRERDSIARDLTGGAVR